LLSTWYKILAVAVVASMAAALGTMVYLDGRATSAALKPGVASTLSGVSASGDEYMGAYLGSERIGWMKTSTARQGDGWVIKQESELVITVQGQARKIVIDGAAEVGPKYQLRSFSFRMSTDPTVFSAQGIVGDKELLVVLNAGEGPKQYTIPIKNELFVDLNVDKYLAARGLKPGESFTIDLFDPQTMATIPVKVEVMGTESLKVMGVDVYATKLRRIVGGAKFDSWIDVNGRSLREEGPLGITMVREAPGEHSSAKPSSGGSHDLVDVASIPVAKTIPNPERWSVLKLRLSGVDLSPYELTGGRQILDGDVLTVRKFLPPEYGATIPVTDPEFSLYLKPAPLIESDSPEILKAAREAIKGENNLLAAARRINDYLFMKLKKKNVVGVPDALATLKSQEGDCNEHSFLFVAMARSVGIPARVAAGIAYLQGRFYYHAWPEIFAGRWVTLDPTWGQAPADVTHVRFIADDMSKLAEIVGLMGNLKIEVVEWQ
jgi:hypothetical protein